jgi:NTE family protein
VLNVLEDYGIYPDNIVGTSMGAIIGALYASGLKAGEIKQIALEINWRQVIRLTDINFPLSGLVQDKRIMALLKSVLQDSKFSELKIDFACVATDMYTGEQVVLNSGSLVDAIRASIAIPGVFAPAKYEKRLLVDGGLVNVVPVSVCREMGADFIIGVNVISDPLISRIASNEISIKESEDEDDMQKPIVPETSVIFRNRVNSIKKAINQFILYGQPRKGRLSMINIPLFVPSRNLIREQLRQRLIERPNLVEVLSQSINIVEYRIAMENLQEANMGISPEEESIGLWQFHRAAEAISQGEKATRAVLRRDDVARIQLAGNRQTDITT